MFVVGALFLIGGLCLPVSMVGSFGWPLALLGFLALLGAAATKWMLEDNAARQLHSCQKQLALLDKQHATAKDERTTLDQHLADGGGPPAAQLQSAEAELAQLEELIPHEAKIQSTQQDLETAQQQSAQARDELRGAHRRWRAALSAAGLPKNLRPSKCGNWRGTTASLATSNGNGWRPSKSATAAAASWPASPPGSTRYLPMLSLNPPTRHQPCGCGNCGRN